MNLLEDNLHVSNFYKEYLNHVCRYQNYNRSAVFVRYFHINSDLSSRDDQTQGTFDKFSDLNGIKYDLYEQTPAFIVDQLINTSEERKDVAGFNFSNETSITIYTIQKPSMNDVIVFPFKPNDSVEIFRVKNISTTVNSNRTGPIYFKLDLEYAPITSLGQLKVVNQFIYLLTLEKYITIKLFNRIVSEAEIIQEILTNCSNLFFNERKELFYFNYNGYIIAPIMENKMIYDNLVKFRHYFDNYKVPFGVLDFSLSPNTGFDFISETVITLLPTMIPQHETISDIRGFVNSPDAMLYDLSGTLNLFSG